MKCQDYRELFPDFLSGSITKTLRQEVENHLAGCTDCRKEFENTKKVWDLMGDVKEPALSETARVRFDAILSNFKEELILTKTPLEQLINNIRDGWQAQFKPRLVFSTLFLAAGLFIGYLLHRPSTTQTEYNGQIKNLTSQVNEMRQLMMLSLLENPSASQRILAVSYTDEIRNADQKVIDALFTTLNEDPNVNVRLATLEALVKYSDKAEVREGLVRSIGYQDSPLMQTAIADVMVKLRVKSSVPSLQKLLSKKDINQLVKNNIQKNINKLI